MSYYYKNLSSYKDDPMYDMYKDIYESKIAEGKSVRSALQSVWWVATKESRNISMETPTGEEGITLGDTLVGDTDVSVDTLTEISEHIPDLRMRELFINLYVLGFGEYEAVRRCGSSYRLVGKLRLWLDKNKSWIREELS